MTQIRINNPITLPQYDIDAYGQIIPLDLKQFLPQTLEVTRMNDLLILDEGTIIPFDAQNMSFI